MSGLESQQVSWWPSHECAAQWAAEHGIDLIDVDLPNPDTPRWCGLPDAHKLAALLLRPRKAGLRSTNRPAPGKQGCHGSADWSAISRKSTQHRLYAVRLA
jgi:hypothetical protein